jgi:hypothetical protein
MCDPFKAPFKSEVPQEIGEGFRLFGPGCNRT